MIDLTHAELKKVLDTYAFTYTEIPRSDKIPCDTFFVGLGEDYQKRPLILNIRLFDQAAESPPDGAPKKLYFLNFFVTYPFGVHQPAFPDISRLILLLNKILPLPGFGLSEMDRVVFYHYTQLSTNGKVDPDFILSMIALIIHYVNVHAKTFEAVASREKTFTQVLEEASHSVDSLENDV